MHLMRLGEAGGEQPVARAGDGQLYDLSGLTGDIDGAFLAADGIARVTEALAAGTLPLLDGTGLRVGSPVARPTKVVCIGLNYREHALESGAAIPTEPVIFM
jgi:2-keto-4-pentenoate hydratase/2-oxohepta-3-ene-1,7-dioic acid hydratase in catechol pathway